MPETKLCILDAGPIIHLDQIGSLSLLGALGEVVVTETVAMEAQKHRPGLDVAAHFEVVVDAENFPSRVVFAASRHSLDAGELAALAWGEIHNADLFVSDDKNARLAAKELGYEITGTLGVILYAARRSTIAKSDAITLLQRIPKESTLYVREDLLAETIASLR